MKMQTESYTITKKIAKHGSQAVIVIPTVLNRKLKPQMLVKVTIEIIEEIYGDKE